MLRRNDPGLRSLESSLRLAYVEKARAAQRAELAELRAREAEEKRYEAARIEAQLAVERRLEREKEAAEAEAKLDYRGHLARQIEEQQRRRNRAFVEFLEEKRLVDEIIAKVRADRRRAKLSHLAAKQAAKEDIDTFVAIQAEMEAKEREKIQSENVKIREFLARKEAWIEEQDKIQAQKRAVKHEKVLQMAEEIRRRESEEAERRQLMLELDEGRLNELERRKERMEIEETLRKKLDMKLSNEMFLRLKRETRSKEMEEEKRFERELAEKMAERDRLEQLSDQKRRLKRMEHMKEIRRLIEVRKAEKEAEKRSEVEMWEERRREEARMDRIIEEERINLLQKHAEKLIGHIPGKLLKPGDLELLGDGVRKSFQQRPYKDALEELESLYK